MGYAIIKTYELVDPFDGQVIERCKRISSRSRARTYAQKRAVALQRDIALIEIGNLARRNLIEKYDSAGRPFKYFDPKLAG